MCREDALRSAAAGAAWPGRVLQRTAVVSTCASVSGSHASHTQVKRLTRLAILTGMLLLIQLAATCAWEEGVDEAGDVR